MTGLFEQPLLPVCASKTEIRPASELTHMHCGFSGSLRTL